MATISVTSPAKDRVRYDLTIEQDDSSVRGNALASGNDATDKRVEDEILSRLDNGDVWAWATVGVTAVWRGVKGNTDYLGSCSYADEADFIKNSGQYEEMKNTAYDNLIEALRTLAI